jgi:glycopeptide antibiotics resistance protein
MDQSSELGSRWILALLALGSLAFAIYGSLVPLDYSPLSLQDAWERFRSLRDLRTGLTSRSDWATNTLLFVPLGFFALGWLWPTRGVWTRLLTSSLVWLATIAVSVSIEFSQFWFPPRTPSLNDIVAQSMGSLAGILFWWVRGPALWAWVSHWREARGVPHVSEYLLLAYLGGLFLYNVLPLDLTISPVEIYHKWQGNGVNLIPFGYPTEGLEAFVYGIVVDVLLWVPVSLLWVVSGRRRPVGAFWMTLGAALLLEFCQFFVYSRVSDVTDLITAAVGAGIGALAGSRLRQGEGRGAVGQASGSGRAVLPWILLGVLGWIGVLCLVFWYPFGFSTDVAFLRERLPLLYQVPFHNYYYGSEFRAVTEVLHKLLFFAPLGALLALGRFQIRRFSPLRTLYTGMALVIMVGVPLLIELGQVGLPDKYPDSTDWMLKVLGAGAGFLLASIVHTQMLLRPPPRRTPPRAIAAGRELRRS